MPLFFLFFAKLCIMMIPIWLRRESTRVDEPTIGSFRFWASPSSPRWWLYDENEDEEESEYVNIHPGVCAFYDQHISQCGPENCVFEQSHLFPMRWRSKCKAVQLQQIRFHSHRFSTTPLLLNAFLPPKAVKLYKTLILHKTLGNYSHNSVPFQLFKISFGKNYATVKWFFSSSAS